MKQTLNHRASYLRGKRLSQWLLPLLVLIVSALPYFALNHSPLPLSQADSNLVFSNTVERLTPNNAEPLFLFSIIQFGIAILAFAISAILSVYFKIKYSQKKPSDLHIWKTYLIFAFVLFGLSSALTASISHGIVFVENNLQNAITLSWSASSISYSTLVALSILYLIAYSQYRIDPSNAKLISYGLFSALILCLGIIHYFAIKKQHIFIGHSDDAFIKNPVFFLSFASATITMTLIWVVKKQIPHLVTNCLLIGYIPFSLALLQLSLSTINLNYSSTYYSLLLQGFCFTIILVTLSISLFKEPSVSPFSHIEEPTLHATDRDKNTLPLHHMSLGIKIPAFVFLVSILFFQSIASIFFVEEKNTIYQNAINKLQIKTDLLVQNFESLHKNAISDAQVLSRLSIVQEYLSLHHNFLQTKSDKEPPSPESLQKSHSQVASALTQFASANEFYIQLRVIDLNGKELIKILRNSRGVQLTPESELQEKSLRPYFRDSIKLKNNQVYISKVELNREFGKIELPYQPVIRFVTPVFSLSNEEKQGYIVINFAFNSYINNLNQSTLNDFNIYIANMDGDYLYHPSPQKQFGFELETRHLIQNEFPVISEVMLSELNSKTFKQLQHKEGAPKLVALFRQFKAGNSNDEQFFNLLITEKTNQTSETVSYLFYRNLVISLALSLICLAISILAAKSIVSQLFTIINALNLFQRTGYHGNLGKPSNDEIGFLSSTFTSLLEEMEQNRKANDINEKAVKEKEHILQGILDSAADAIINIDTSGKILAFNRSAENMFGYKEDEIIQQSVTQLMPTEHGNNHQQYIEQYLLTGKSSIIGKGRKLIAVRKNGEEFPIHLAISKVHAREGIIFTGMIRDYSEEEQAKKALEESRNQLELVINSTGLGVWDWNIQTDTIKVNKRWAEIVGYNFDEFQLLTFDRWMLLLQPEDQNQASRLLEHHWNGNTELFVFENRIRHKQGHWVWVLDTGKAIEWFADGKPKRMIGTHLDISHQKRVEKELLESKETAEKATKYKSEFLASMSHEIRTPMNGVLGMLELVLKGKLDNEQRHYLSLAKSSADSLLTIINDILDFSKVEAGKLEIESREFDMRNLLEQIFESFSLMAEEKGLNLMLETEAIQHTNLIGDPNRIRQILINLLGNAFKFTKTGQIKVQARLNAEETEPCQFHCSIIDSGIGIPADKLDRLFQSYNQADSSTSREYGGTGLGLFIVKKLCNLMGGDITVSSNEHGGSTFSFWISLKRCEKSIYTNNAEEQLHISSSQDNEQNTPIIFPDHTKILLVDDSPINQAVALGLLEDYNLEIEVADNGQHCLDQLTLSSQETPFQLILMDCQMPEMDGFEATQKIRNGFCGHRYQEIPIIAMTANAIKGDREKCIEAGMNDYITKPINPELLLGMLRQYLIEDETESEIETSTTKNSPLKLVNGTTNDVTHETENEVSLRDHNLWDHDAALQHLMKNEETLNHLVNRFIQDLPIKVEALKHSLDTNNQEQALQSLHAMKEITRNLKTLLLNKHVLELEETLLNNNVQSAKYAFSELYDIFMATFRLIEEHQFTKQHTFGSEP